MTKTIDLTFLNTFTSGNPEKIKKYILMFLNYCPGQLILMREQLNTSNYDGLRGTAHSLKPQITYMGILDGEPLVKKIESIAASKTEVNILPELLNNFQKVCEQAIVELKEEIE